MGRTPTQTEEIQAGGGKSERATGIDLDEIERWIEQARGQSLTTEEVEINPQVGMTTQEWADAWETSIERTRDRLRKMKRMGRLQIGKARRLSLSDTEYVATVYRVIYPHARE